MSIPVVASMVALAFLQGEPSASKPMPDLPNYVFAVSPEDENLDVLYFGEARPTLIRFRVRINGQGYRSSWDYSLARLYKFADSNDDGTLTEAEANQPGWVQLITNPFGGIFSNSGPNSIQRDGRSTLEAKDGKVSLEQFSKYVRDALGHGALTSQALQSNDPVDQSTFNQFDLDRDGALSASELAQAEALIGRLDVDEDEVLDTVELNPNRNPFAGVFFADGGGAAGDSLAGPIVSLSSAEAPMKAALRLLARYDGIDGSTRDERLSPVESALAADAFRLADTSGDGRLDLGEIERFLAEPSPTIVLVVRIAVAPRLQGATISLPEPGEVRSAADPRLKTKPNRGLVLDLDGHEVRLNAVDTVRDNRQIFNMRFDLADGDKDGMLDRLEAEKSRIFLSFFDPADRNADNKLSRGEVTLYLDRTLDLEHSRVSLTITDSGRPFFDSLDNDADNRLCRRELREVAKRLKPFDRNGDSQVRLEEIPSTFQLAVGRGPSFPNRRQVAFDQYDTPLPARPNLGSPDVAWFRRMDRNHDGDVSLREFLGTLADFRKLDADGDGLIDPREAAKGP